MGNVVNKINKKPTSELELVELENTVEHFRAVDLKNLREEFQNVKLWMGVLFESNFLLTQNDFQAMKESANWVKSIDSIVDAREQDHKYEREALENKFKELRGKFQEDLN